MKYEDTKRSSAQIIRAVYEHIYVMNAMHTPKRKATHWDINILEMLRIPVKTTLHKAGKWIVWSKPQLGLIKMNVDGSKRGDTSSGGGVLRNEEGIFMFGFSTVLTRWV